MDVSFFIDTLSRKKRKECKVKERIESQGKKGINNILKSMILNIKNKYSLSGQEVENRYGISRGTTFTEEGVIVPVVLLIMCLTTIWPSTGLASPILYLEMAIIPLPSYPESSIIRHGPILPPGKRKTKPISRRFRYEKVYGIFGGHVFVVYDQCW